MNGMNCSHGFREFAEAVSNIWAAVITIAVLMIVSFIFPQKNFAVDEFWGIEVNRYQIIASSGIVAYIAGYFSVKRIWCRRCPGLPEKTEIHFGFPYIV